jgi:hypothetical protein
VRLRPCDVTVGFGFVRFSFAMVAFGGLVRFGLVTVKLSTVKFSDVQSSLGIVLSSPRPVWCVLKFCDGRVFSGAVLFGYLSYEVLCSIVRA